MYKNCFKRLIDFTLSLVAFIILSPLLVVLAIITGIKMNGNPFFVQERPGKDGKIFKLLKFRSMTEEKDKDGNYLPDDVRLTEYGKWIRRTSLDELPQLINIIKGDMAIVGPRPLLVQYLPLYNEFQRHRHDVRPGLTGATQVNGRANIDWKTRFEIDVDYVNNVTFMNDLKIIIKTVKAVFNEENIENETQGTWYPFTGNN